MEPVTHLLTGACLARAGCNRRAAYATLAMVVGAQLPDIDTLWGLRGPVEGFVHHRGITHTFLGVPFEAAAVVGAVYGLHRWRMRRRDAKTNTGVSPLRQTMKPFGSGRDDSSLSDDSGRDDVFLAKPLTKVPVRWGELYGFTLLALLSHLLLDFTNNYGLRPFFPFNDHWYATSIVFIVDPLILVLLVAALVLPSLFALVNSEVGARKEPFRGRGLAIAALLGIVVIWTFRAFEHGKAVDVAMAQSIAAPPMSQIRDMGHPERIDPTSEGQDVGHPDIPPVYLTAQRVLANPDPLNPFHWAVVTDFGPVYQLADVDTRNGAINPEPTTYPKPSRDRDILLAEASPLGRAYIDWSPMPIMTEGAPMYDGASADTVDVPLPAEAAVVTFRDPRFMGGAEWLHITANTPLTGTVVLDRAGHVLQQTMDGRSER